MAALWKMLMNYGMVVKVTACQALVDKNRRKESCIVKWGAFWGTSLDWGTPFFSKFWGDWWIQPRCGREEESCGKVQSCWGFFPSVSALDPLYKILFSPCQITAPYLHIGAITIMVLLSWPMALHAIRADKKGIVTLLPAPCMHVSVGKQMWRRPFLPYPRSSWS